MNLAILNYYPPAYDQGNLGSCTANGIAFCFHFDVLKTNSQDNFVPSRLFIYFCERVLDSINYDPYSSPPITTYPELLNFINDPTIKTFSQNDSDTGSNDFQGIDVLSLYGVCNEKYWPYSDNSTDYKTIPIDNWQDIVKDCNNHKAKSFYSVGGLTTIYDGNPSFFFDDTYKNDLLSIKNALCLGYPIVFGINIPKDTDNDLNNYPFSSSFSSSPTIIDIPSSYINAENKQEYISNSDNFVGGHCIVIVGYDDNLKAFIIRNSWGTNWGIKGHFYLSYNFIEDPNLANDFWILKDIIENN